MTYKEFRLKRVGAFEFISSLSRAYNLIEYHITYQYYICAPPPLKENCPQMDGYLNLTNKSKV